MTADEMVGWHHRLNGHGFRWTLGVGDGQGGLAYCSSCGRKEVEQQQRDKIKSIYRNKKVIKMSN